jgi:hypothetical protein
MEIASIFKECVDTRSLVLEKLVNSTKKSMDTTRFKKSNDVSSHQLHDPNIKDAAQY